MKTKNRFSLRFQVICFTVFCGFVPLLLTVSVLQYTFMHFFETRMEQHALEIAMWAANDIDVKKAYSMIPVDKDRLQKTANDLKNRTGAYIIFTDMRGISFVEPYSSRVWTTVVGGGEERVLQGETYTSRAIGVSGPAIRCFVPITVDDVQVGAVVAAFLEPDIQHILSQLYNSVYTVIPLALLILIILSMLLANNIKKRLFGMEPQEIGTRLIEREGILHSVKEGIIATDEDLNITVVNHSAEELFPKDTKLIGENITKVIADSPLPDVIVTKKPQYNKQLSINKKIVLSNSFPLFIKDKVVGTVITFSNLNEVHHLAEELTGVNKIVEALRARTHEFSNKLHAISGLLQLGSYEEASKYAASVSRYEETLLSCLLGHFRINAVTGLLMGKASQAEEKRIKFNLDTQSFLYSLPDYFDEHAIVIVLGNLIENAFDAAMEDSEYPEVYVSVKQTDTLLKIEVKDNGSGIPEDIRESIYEPGFTTKSHGTGYGLANVASRVKAANGAIEFTTSDQGTTFYVTIPFEAPIGDEQGGKEEWS
ncbi:MAG: sensor histidine kinase [Peptococcaceae bacterium]|nr:sensor histidine kinase [Peptococcaceae bacterium]